MQLKSLTIRQNYVLKIIGLIFLSSLISCNYCKSKVTPPPTSPEQPTPAPVIPIPITQDMIDKALAGNTATINNIVINSTKYDFLVQALQDFKNDVPRNIDEPDQNECTALWYAAELGDLDILQALLSRGANMNYKDSDGNTALHRLCGDPKAIEWFLQQPNISVNEQNVDGKTPLKYALDSLNSGAPGPVATKLNKTIQLLKNHNGVE